MYVKADRAEAEAARKAKRPDGKSRLPPGQKLIKTLRPMGGKPGKPKAKDFKLKVHGLVKNEITVDFNQLYKLPQVKQTCDVHCVTRWTVLDAVFHGVKIKDLLSAAGGTTEKAKYIIFEAAHGYTANLPLAAATKDNCIVAYRYNNRFLKVAHGAPVRAIIPDHYFWKSAKWLTGIRVSEFDERGYWETRGYHNYADPWKEQRYS